MLPQPTEIRYICTSKKIQVSLLKTIMILFMKKTKLLSALAVAAVMLPAATSCNDKNDEPVVSPSE